MSRLRPLAGLFFVVTALSGCDQVNTLLNKQQANGKAIGAACRHSGRALEDCFSRNPKIAKSDIFAGWKEMNEYMLARKMDVVPSSSEDCGPDPEEKKKAAPDQHNTSAASAPAKDGE
ncbi:hypothetical protein HNQ50_001053 [Silvimonas terrae]|uniref:Lipoprotein n=1 Tax=Silvimonas terrae TaxID=300266 RepID=A0A840RDI8_9NEIS|nr:hypothetical protein [Silvimonas terrae]MBB5190331.1 hypothetical protein [Silvimonas terrae]